MQHFWDFWGTYRCSRVWAQMFICLYVWRAPCGSCVLKNVWSECLMSYSSNPCFHPSPPASVPAAPPALNGFILWSFRNLQALHLHLLLPPLGNAAALTLLFLTPSPRLFSYSPGARRNETWCWFPGSLELSVSWLARCLYLMTCCLYFRRKLKSKVCVKI